MSVLNRAVVKQSAARGSIRAFRYLTNGTTALALLFGSGVALAQPADPGSSDKPCTASTTGIEPSAPDSLIVLCGAEAFPLGHVESFRLLDLPELNSVIVTTKADRRHRVWMLIQQRDGSFALEDISGLVAGKAGRGASRDLRGLDLEIDRQVAESPGKASINSVQNRGLGGLADVDLAAVAERSRATTQENVAEENGGSGAEQ